MSDELDQLLGTFESCWAVARRRRWWILITIFLTWAAVWGVSWLLPSTYQSEALILLEQQNVPNQYVVPNVSASIQDRLQAISQQVLSRTRLQATIDRFHLYPESHGLRVLLDSGDPIERMRKDIEIQLVQAPGHPDEFTAFKLHYTAKSPELAQQVNAELLSPFVKENVEAREQASEDTTSFLENQLAVTRSKMEEQEAKVAAFKAKHVGELPSPMEMNVQQIVGSIQAQLQNSHQALEVAKQRRNYLESLLRQYQSGQASAKGGNNTDEIAGNTAPSSLTAIKELNKELTDLCVRLQDLQERYTDDHPDVMALKDKIDKKQKQIKQAEAELAANAGSRQPAISTDPEVADAASISSSASLTQLESELRANQSEIQNYQKHENELESQVSAYLARLNMAPAAEQELAAISRDYEESKANYNSLLQKKMQSELATSLEERQKGEQFRILDPPSLPNKHIAPNRFKFSVDGLGLGILLGLAIAAILEVTDIRVRHEEDLKAVLPALVLIRIPRLSTPTEEDVDVMARWLDFGAVMIVITLIAIGNFYAFFKR